MQLVRLVTVHPALVHVTLGTLPVLVLAYVLARRRRSAAWAFAGDVALGVTAAVTLLAAASGLISFLVIGWPGGLELWRWLHLVLGVATAVALLALAGYRLRRQVRSTVPTRNTILATTSTVVLIATTGWIGGEVLVFRGGIGVIAAGDGALAPPTFPEGDDDVYDVMAQVRAAWARITTMIATMVVQEPSDDRFDAIAHDAEALRALSQQLTALSLSSPMSVHARSGAAGRTDHADTEEPGHGMGDMAKTLGEHAARLGELARDRDLPQLAEELGRTTAECAHCHAELRWQ